MSHHQWWLPSKSGSFLRHSKMSWHDCIRRSFWSSFSNFSTIFPLTFLIPKPSVIILEALSRFKPSPSAINHSTIATHHLPDTLNVGLSLLVKGLLLRGSSSTSSHPFLNFLSHSKTRERDSTRNFRLVCCSVLIAGRCETKNMYSKACKRIINGCRSWDRCYMSPRHGYTFMHPTKFSLT